jgi:hypothetical protein
VARYRVDLHIPAAELLRYYRGEAATVVAWDACNRRVQFPAAALRPFVSAAGVYGTFVLHVDEHNRLQRIEREPSPPGMA